MLPTLMMAMIQSFDVVMMTIQTMINDDGYGEDSGAEVEDDIISVMMRMLIR